MNSTTFLSSVYAIGGVAGCACYAPQLFKLWSSAEARRSMSPVAWGGWSALGIISMAYAAEVTHDQAMMLVNGANLVCQLAVFALAAGQRLRDTHARAPIALPGIKT